MYKIPTKYYEDIHNEISNLSIQSFQKRSEFWRDITIVSSSLCGILVSLHDNVQEPLCIRVVFLCLIVVLTIGVSTSGITLYNYSILLERHRQEVERELLSALNTDRLVSEVHTGLSRKKEFVEWLALFALLSTPFLLLAYTILRMCVI
nr:MAG TPA: hypothetical protein [Caudoviricetes sp.]